MKAGDISVTAFTRLDLLPSPIETKLDRLEKLERNDRISSLTVAFWPSDVPIGSDTSFPEVVDTFELFRDWARAAGVNIQPPFEVRSVDSMVHDDTTRLRTPGLCLAIELDGKLHGVFPHSAGETQYGTEEAIAYLEREDVRIADAVTDRAIAVTTGL